MKQPSLNSVAYTLRSTHTDENYYKYLNSNSYPKCLNNSCKHCLFRTIVDLPDQERRYYIKIASRPLTLVLYLDKVL